MNSFFQSGLVALGKGIGVTRTSVEQWNLTFVAAGDRVALEALEARAGWPVVGHVTLGVRPAVARHHALGVDARAVVGALVVDAAPDAQRQVDCRR